MPHIQHWKGKIKRGMILQVTGNEQVRATCSGLRRKRTSRSGADGNAADALRQGPSQAGATPPPAIGPTFFSDLPGSCQPHNRRRRRSRRHMNRRPLHCPRLFQHGQRQWHSMPCLAILRVRRRDAAKPQLVRQPGNRTQRIRIKGRMRRIQRHIGPKHQRKDFMVAVQPIGEPPLHRQRVMGQNHFSPRTTRCGWIPASDQGTRRGG